MFLYYVSFKNPFFFFFLISFKFSGFHKQDWFRSESTLRKRWPGRLASRLLSFRWGSSRAGGWKQVKVYSFPCLRVGICGWLDFGEGRQVKHLPWTPRFSLQPGLACNMGPVPGWEPGRSSAALSHLTLQFTQHHFHHLLFNRSKSLLLGLYAPFFTEYIFKT